ncbi:hypothetical protein WN943_007360 [Citrus x changshan-huyou]
MVSYCQVLQTKRTKKAGIVGKYVLRRWRSVNTVSTSVNSMGRSTLRRGRLWESGVAKTLAKLKAGGAYTLKISSAVTVKNIIWRVKEQIES